MQIISVAVAVNDDRNELVIDRDTVDNLLTAADSNENIGNNNANIDSMLQQLLAATTSLQTSVNNINIAMNEMKSQQNDMQTDIDHLHLQA